MKTKRNGFTLIEMLTVIILVTAVVVSTAGVFASMLQGMTRSTRTVAADRTLDHMLDRLRQDVRGARAVALAGKPSEAWKLDIGRDKIEVTYSIQDGNITRTAVDGNQQTGWEVPGAAIELRLWPAEGPPQALEVHTNVAEAGNGMSQQKLARTHVFFFAGVEGRNGK
jgi:prepilin-type N-terminal cleavage/methylation domain-containing protein